jgi:ribulose-5-phosphate 4-epimerase/fuculose-1-phosphate aldolase
MDAFTTERIDLAAAFRWAARLDLHEGVANHFSLALDDTGKHFLINPNQRHFSLIKASDLLLLDADDPHVMHQANAPDPTAWGLHGSIHRLCPQARCVMHVHSPYSTALASLADSTLPPIDQNAAMFYQRHVVDDQYGGLAFTEEGERCASLLVDPKTTILVMSHHGVLSVGPTVAEAFNRLYYFERAARNYILALQTGKPLRVLPHAVAEKTAAQLEVYPDYAERHLSDIKEILMRQEPDFAQ